MKIYLDTNIVSAIVRGDLSRENQDALENILAAFQKGSVEFCTSQVTREELEKIPNQQHRAQHVRLSNLIRLVPIAQEFYTDSGLSMMGVGGGRHQVPLYRDLRGLLDENDARHVFQAIKNQVQVFLTADGPVLGKQDQLSKHGIKAMSPAELDQELSRAS